MSKKVIGGLAVATMLMCAAPLAFAQTSSSTDTTGSTTSSAPGSPNTGSGGDAAGNLFVLGVSGLAVLAGGAYLTRKFAAR